MSNLRDESLGSGRSKVIPAWRDFCWKPSELEPPHNCEGNRTMNGTDPLENGDSQDFWTGAREGRLVFQKCRICGSIQFPPRHHCAACWESDLEAYDSSGRGTVESLTIVRRAPAAQFSEKVPYVVAAIAVEEGPRMITNLVGDGALNAKIDDPVVVTFPQEATVLPQFRLVAGQD